MSISWQAVPFAEGYKARCDCCDRTGYLDTKLLVLAHQTLYGDLDLCSNCAPLLLAALTGQTTITTDESASKEGMKISGS